MNRETIPGTRMRVDWEALVSSADVLLPALPATHGDSLRLGNGDIGAAVSASGGCLVVFFGKNDLLDYRKKEAAHDPSATASSLAGTPTPTTKPAGIVRFHYAAPRSDGLPARLGLWDAAVSTPDLRAFVARGRDLAVLEYRDASGGAFDLELARNRDSTGVIDTLPEFGAEGSDLWVRYRFPADPDTYPEGFEYVLYLRIEGDGEFETELVPGFATVHQPHSTASLKGVDVVEDVVRARFAPCGPITVYAALKTTRDDPDPFGAARDEAQRASREGAASIREAHEAAWHAFWKRSFVSIDGRDFLRAQWLRALYHLACATAPGKVGPGLFGPWAEEDFPPWGNDRHWDYNVQAALWGAYSSDHTELADAYDDEIVALLPSAREMARRYYGIGGAKFPIVGWPRRYVEPAASRKAEFTTPWINGLDAQPMWWRYRLTRDLAYLRDKAYPVIEACAEFYEDFVEEAGDGRFDMPPTAVWDLAFMVPDARNAIIDLAFAKMLLRTAAVAARELGVDADRAARWEDVASRLREYPSTVVDPDDLHPVDHRAGKAKAHYPPGKADAGPVWVAYEGYPVIEYNLPPWTMHIYPCGETGLHSPAEERAQALRTLRITPFYLWDDLVMLSVAWARLGCDMLDTVEELTRHILHPNGCQSYPPDCWASKWIFMHYFGWPAILNENLLQGYTGILRVAPVSLKEGARFARLRADGAFLVSAEIAPGGRVRYVAIESEAGAPCAVHDAWGGRARVRKMKTGSSSDGSLEPVEAATREGVLRFATEPGAAYVIDDPADPWGSAPFVDIGASA